MPEDTLTALAGYAHATNTPPYYGLINKNEIEIDGSIRKIVCVLNGMAKDGVWQSDVTIQNARADDQIYLGRNDKREAFSFSSSNLHINDIDMVFHFSGAGWIFNEDDIGKPIPVWISTEPPPY